MSVSLKTDGWDEINWHLSSAMAWLRENSDHFNSPRRISFAIRGLIAGGDPPKSHHVQRLVTKLQKLQYNQGNYKDGSWTGDVSVTAYSLIALNKASLENQPDRRKVDYLKEGLIFLEKNYDKKLKNWLDYLPETILSCQAILELGDFENQRKNIEDALDWLCTRKNSNETCFVSTKYTAEIVQVLLLSQSRLSTKKYDDFINFGIKHIIDSEKIGKWSDDPWAVSECLLAIMKYDKLAKVRMPMIRKRIGQLMETQSTENAWSNSVTKTVNCIMVYAESLGYKQINENKIKFWTTFRPTSAHFSWDQYPQGIDQETKAIGKINKIQRDLSPTILEEYVADLSLEDFQNTVNNKLQRVSSEADNVRKRNLTPLVNKRENRQENFVIKTLEDVGKDIYTQLLQHGENNRRYEEELAKNKVDHLTINPDDKMSVVPWELIFDGNDFCCLKYSVGRLLKSARNFENSPNSNKKIKVLLVGDPSGDLPEANKEIEFVKKYFDNDSTELDVFTNETFDVRNENFRNKFLPLLRDKKYDIIHYAGHADFDDNKGKSYLYFQKPNDNSTDKVSALEVSNYIQASGSTPKIVFFNACSSAARENAEDSKQITFDRKFSNLAKDFVSGFSNLNIPVYVGSIWPIHDKEAAEFAITFYESIKHGCTVGDATRLARIESYLNHPDQLTWASFILYGDPARKLDILRGIQHD